MKRVRKPKISSKRKTSNLGWAESNKNISTLRKVEKATQDERMERIQPPKTVEDFENIRITTLELMGNPYCHEFMFRTLSNKLDVIDGEIASKTALDILKDKPNITKGDREMILNAIQMLMQNIKKNIPYVNREFSEQMDKTITEAKGEIEAFIEHKIRTAGLEAIGASKSFPTIKELTETLNK